ncbi:hypothetical protein BLOT_001130 [Blomia tropicalis]|nr:hypothetical protein BLOT_001130 [Blomia tropicalis]
MRELWGESSVSNARRDSFILVTMYDKVYKRDKCNGQMRRTLARPTTTELVSILDDDDHQHVHIHEILTQILNVQSFRCRTVDYFLSFFLILLLYVDS